MKGITINSLVKIINFAGIVSVLVNCFFLPFLSKLSICMNGGGVWLAWLRPKLQQVVCNYCSHIEIHVYLRDMCYLTHQSTSPLIVLSIFGIDYPRTLSNQILSELSNDTLIMTSYQIPG